MKGRGLIVVKIGTNGLMRNGRMDQRIFNRLARQIHWLRTQGYYVVVVSSGGIRAGREALAHIVDQGFINLADLQDDEIAATGARHLLNHWGRALRPYGRDVPQIWPIHSQLRGYIGRHLRARIMHCLECGLIPIINEYDIVSKAEIDAMKVGGENDHLAERVAMLLKASSILFLTTCGGVYTTNPHHDEQAQRYLEVDWRNIEDLKVDDDTSSDGHGGMLPKLKAALTCARRGMRVAIASPLERNVITRFVQGKEVGTAIGTRTRL